MDNIQNLANQWQSLSISEKKTVKQVLTVSEKMNLITNLK
jgi:hypothetical protein